MNAQVVYDASGNVVSVTFLDPEASGHAEVVPGEGESVMTVDASAIARLSIGGEDEGAVALAIMTEHSVDAANSQLVQK